MQVENEIIRRKHAAGNADGTPPIHEVPEEFRDEDLLKYLWFLLFLLFLLQLASSVTSSHRQLYPILHILLLSFKGCLLSATVLRPTDSPSQSRHRAPWFVYLYLKLDAAANDGT
jgi:hypothetical protein